MKGLFKTAQFLILALVASMACAGSKVDVKNMRTWQAPDNTRVVFDLSKPVEYRVFSLSNPNRVVIDMTDAKLVGKLDVEKLTGDVVKGVRHGEPEAGVLRVVLDLGERVTPATQVLAPNKVYGNRLVVDLKRKEQQRVVKAAPMVGMGGIPKIAIDAGHGGEDYGASGRGRTHEKTVVLAIARELEKLIKADPKLDAELTRKGDYFIPLRQRIQIARQKQQADIFVSIHADSYDGTKASGASVYALSRRGATSERAKRLAAKENASDFIGGVSLQDKDRVVQDVLLDLSLTQQISESLDLGKDVLGELGKVSHLHKRSVEQAGFVVLKSPDIPSILVETAFISNPREEKMLRSRNHQKKIAKAIYNGIKRYVDSGRVRKIVAEQAHLN